ncbi:hypothetical protein CJ469_04858 [Nocardia farcinica]|nr:hypothetical protein CJ469_04858 [Nocardia farcinica]PFX06283.1 hypothetical protein CJ468_04673 [Nocardia farcinica]
MTRRSRPNWYGYRRSQPATPGRPAAAQTAPAPAATSRNTSMTRCPEPAMPLTEEQRGLLDAAFEYPARIDHEYPGDEAKRWVLGRAISLGWTPKFFGEFDRRIVSRDRGREGHKAERWGKKYQWMAYHELLARVADNYQPSKLFDEDATYDGLYQIVGDREIDPSLPPIDFRIFNDHGGKGTTAWGVSPVQLVDWPAKQLNFDRYKGDIYSLLDDVDSEPTASDVLFVRDADGKYWIVLECEMKQVDPLAHEGWRGLQQDVAVDSFLIRAQDGRRFSTAAVELRAVP